MTAASDVGSPELSWLDARLLALDPDLEELFAEVDDILRGARARWRQRPGEARDRSGAPRWQPPRLRGRRPRPASATQRSPPPACCCNPVGAREVMPVYPTEDSRAEGGTCRPSSLHREHRADRSADPVAAVAVHSHR